MINFSTKDIPLIALGAAADCIKSTASGIKSFLGKVVKYSTDTGDTQADTTANIMAKSHERNEKLREGLSNAKNHVYSAIDKVHASLTNATQEGLVGKKISAMSDLEVAHLTINSKTSTPIKLVKRAMHTSKLMHANVVRDGEIVSRKVGIGTEVVIRKLLNIPLSLVMFTLAKIGLEGPKESAQILINAISITVSQVVRGALLAISQIFGHGILLGVDVIVAGTGLTAAAVAGAVTIATSPIWGPIKVIQLSSELKEVKATNHEQTNTIAELKQQIENLEDADTVFHDAKERKLFHDAVDRSEKDVFHDAMEY